jgi:peptidoglycan/xylan/chitin deacetylase (PgdA/CDA1 family)
MLNFRNTAIFIIIVALVVQWMLISGYKWGLYLLVPMAFALLLLVVGSVKICMNFYLKAFCKGRTDEKIVTLTFDDGPNPAVTVELLKVLKEFNIKAAFFIIGHKAEKHPEIVEIIRQEGHVTGNHSYSHSFFFDFYGRKKMERDLIGGLGDWRSGGVGDWRSGGLGDSGVRRYFRPPYGVTNPTVAKVVKKLGWTVIGWSVRSLDTTIKDPERVVKRVVKRLHPGAVILLHDIRPDAALIVEKIILAAKQNGYRFVGLEEMINCE